jgi:hypothetical protein
MITGWNPSILGYISSGEMVPEVMMTLLNRSKTGPMASAGSKQLQSNLSAKKNGKNASHAHKVEYRIRHGRVFRLIRFENKQEPYHEPISKANTTPTAQERLTLLIRRHQRRKRRNLLQRMVLVEIRQL